MQVCVGRWGEGHGKWNELEKTCSALYCTLHGSLHAHVHTHTHIHTLAHTRTRTRTRTRTNCTITNTHTHASTYLRTHTHACTHKTGAYTLMLARTCAHTRTQQCLSTHTRTGTYSHTPNQTQSCSLTLSKGLRRFSCEISLQSRSMSPTYDARSPLGLATQLGNTLHGVYMCVCTCLMCERVHSEPHKCLSVHTSVVLPLPQSQSWHSQHRCPGTPQPGEAS